MNIRDPQRIWGSTMLERTLSTHSDSESDPSAASEHSDALINLIDCAAPTAGSARHLLADVDEVLFMRGTSRGYERRVRQLIISLPDPRVSSRHARLIRQGDVWALEDLGSKNGTNVNGVRRLTWPLTDGDYIECGRTFLRFRARQELHRSLPPDRESCHMPSTTPGLATFHDGLARQFRALQDVARARLPVLVLGPTGSGKELVARAVHTLSQRTGAYVPVNCGALPQNLVEAELFGCRKGAFTGANENRDGLVRASDGGTLFLDEIGDLPLAAQPALLRVLQEREVLPVGATRQIPVDLRVVAATHRDVHALVDADSFRADLLARLSGIVLHLPSLAERIDDLGLLIAALLGKQRASSRAISPDVIRLFVQYSWPLNIRELEHALTAALSFASDRIMVDHLPAPIRENRPATRAEIVPPPPEAPKTTLSDEQLALRNRLVSLLTEHRGSISEVARRMGKERIQIRRWIRRFDIPITTLRR